MPKKYPLEFKKQAIRRYEKGESIPVLCQKLHISQSTFYHWRKQYHSIQTTHRRSLMVLSGNFKKRNTNSRSFSYLVTYPKCLYRTSWPLWSIFTTKCQICTAFTNYAKPWMCPAVHSTITFSAAQIEANTNLRRLNSC